MASLWKDERTPYWVACFDGFVGIRRVRWKKTTGVRHRKPAGETKWDARSARKLAGRIAEALEDAAQGRMDVARATGFMNDIEDRRAKQAFQSAVDEILRRVTGTGLGDTTPRTFLANWIERNRSTVAETTFLKYEHVARIFVESLGPQADRDFSGVTDADVIRFRDGEAQRVAAKTANGYVKIVRMFCDAAEEAGLVLKNPARRVKALKSRSGGARREFTLPELGKLLAACDDEWRSMVLFGLYTGMRLGDITALCWSQVDLEAGEITYTSAKTGRTTIVPITTPLRSHILALPAGDRPNQPLHPRAFGVRERTGRTGALSNAFHGVMADAGLVVARPKSHAASRNPAKRKGRSGRRATTEISFHALRHTATSLMKKAGVSAAVVMDIIGHESEAVSRHYTHIDTTTKREALDHLPNFLAMVPDPGGTDAGNGAES